MTDRTESGRSDRNNPQLYELPKERKGRFLLVMTCAVLMLAGLLGGYIIGLQLTRSDLAAAKVLIDQLQPESQRLKKQIIEQNGRFAALQAKLNSVQAALKAIVPSENTYNIGPNQSIIVADGHLTIGLIGSPTNDNIHININGTPHTVATGDTIKIAPDAKTACQVGVQSFDMFKAVLVASCAAAKPQ